MLKKGQKIKLMQTPRAERFLAVAAASVLARAAFLNYLKRLTAEYGIEFPKGASNLVDQAGRGFVRLHGPENLQKVAKLHFKNTRRINPA